MITRWSPRIGVKAAWSQGLGRRSRRRGAPTAAGLAVVLALIGTAAAEDDPIPAPPGPVPAPSTIDEREIAERLVITLDAAARSVSEGGGDSKTMELQAAVVHDIDELLARLRASATPSSPQQNEPSGTPTSGQQSGGETSGRTTTNRDAAQASEQATDGAPSADVELAHRRDLARAVWGHLPPKMQEELRHSFSERFAPRYEELIRRYFEALAERPAPSETGPAPGR